MSEFEDLATIAAAPPALTYNRRLTPELRNMPIDHMRPLLVNPETAKAFRNFAKRQGWVISTMTVEGGVRVWRLK
jgi:hypothetical protein